MRFTFHLRLTYEVKFFIMNYSAEVIFKRKGRNALGPVPDSIMEMIKTEVKRKFPVGMIIILVLIGFGVTGLLLGLSGPAMLQIGPLILTGTAAKLGNTCVIAVLLTVFYGIIKRLRWARKLAIGWYAFSIVLAAANLVSFLMNKTLFDGFYGKVLSPEAAAAMNPAFMTASVISGTTVSCIVALVIILYIRAKRDFFVN